VRTILSHAQKVSRIVRQLKFRKSKKPVSLRKKSVAHQVPNPKDKRHSDEKIDVSDLNEILLIDRKKRICVAEPGVTFVDLVDATLRHGLVPIVVPELKTITIGGAVAGCSIESMSYKHGGFHDSCLAYEVITAKGEVLTCTPTNEHKLVFQMMHGTFGTLGIITKLKFKLIPAKRYVHVRYEKYKTLAEYKKAIWKHFKSKDVDFMDGIIHSPSLYVLSVGDFVSRAPYANRYDWMKVYYKSTATRKEDYLRTADYFFRYDKGVTSVTPKSFLGRLLFGKFVSSTQVLWLAEKLHKVIPAKVIPVTLDTFIPFSRAEDFFDWYNEEVCHYPLWCVPYRIVRNYEWINPALIKKNNDSLFLDIAIYGMKHPDSKGFYKMMEDELYSIGGIKTLIADNYYSEKDFWKSWNKKNYYAVKKRTDPDGIFRDLYVKMCKVVRGVGK
jgi:FAD/FMN-containing dehydrogenase